MGMKWNPQQGQSSIQAPANFDRHRAREVRNNFPGYQQCDVQVSHSLSAVIESFYKRALRQFLHSFIIYIS
eukprot:scaffold31227_cov139-Skeletonema_marinoi.AAC.10